MPRSTKPGFQGVYVAFPVELKAILTELAKGNERSLQDEIVHACQRHAKVPPVVRIVREVVEEPLPHEETTHTPTPRGRKPQKPSTPDSLTTTPQTPRTRQRKATGEPQS